MSPRAAWCLLWALSAARADPVPGTATVPLDELYALREAGTAPALRPPVAATVSRLELHGRVLERALDLTAEVEVEVLAERGWTRVPLLTQSSDLHVTRLPPVDGASFAIDGGELCLIAARPGRYRFTLSLLKEAAAQGAQRRVEIALAPAASAVLRLRSDDNLFHVDAAGALRDGEELVFYPRHGRFVAMWQDSGRAAAATAVRRPPVEPVVTLASASVVGTLAGTRLTRLRYDLQLEGTRPLLVRVPHGQALTKVFVNRTPVEFTVADGVLSLAVAPARTGDQTASVELVLSEPVQAYHLAGTLLLAFPQPDWPVHEMVATLHLPPVFDYAWSGGSLAVAETAPMAEYQYALPTPGKVLNLHQELVSAAATVSISYDVALDGRYFR